MHERMKSFKAVLKALNQYEVEYVLVGGVAVLMHDIERFTKDIDLFIKLNSKNIKKLQKALYSVFEDDSIKEITTGEFKQYPVIRYGTPDDYYIDIMERIGKIFKYNDLKYEIIDLQGIPVRVATKDTLIKLKEGTLREHDKLDVALLKKKSSKKS